MKERDQCTSIFHFADRPEVPYEVDFRRHSFPEKLVFRKCYVFGFFWRVILDVSKDIFASLQSFWLGTVTENDERVLTKLSVQLD